MHGGRRTPKDFFAAVREELAAGGRVATPQTRDMNPVWTGKDVSLIDTKQAQRALEPALVDAEKFATLAGRPFPEDRLDLAWRQVFYGAHHDAVTGTGSDQVYVDLLGSWREAYDIAREELDAAASALAEGVDTTGGGVPLVVLNPVSWERADVLRAEAELPWDDAGLTVVGPDGAPVPFVADEVTVGDGVTRVALTLLPPAVGSVGHLALRCLPAPGPVPRWSGEEGTVAHNAYYRVESDPERGGAVSRLTYLPTGKELLPEGALGNEIVSYEEHPGHPNMGEGPWMLTPKGPGTGSGTAPAALVRCESSPVGSRLTVRGSVAGTGFTQTLTLWHGVDRVDCLTRIDEFTATDALLRVRLPVAVAGGRPVAEVGDAAIGRAFGFPDVDSARAPWTLDTPVNHWGAVGSTARVTVGDGEAATAQAIGVAEVVVAAPDAPDSGARELVVALAKAGVTATTSAAGGSRYGHLEVDSNLPDVRISVGLPDDNAFTAAVLAAAGPRYREAFDAQLAQGAGALLWVPAAASRAETFVPMADLRGTRALPVLLVAGSLDEVLAGLGEARIRLRQTPESAALEGLEDFTVAVLNRGTPGFVVDPAGTLHLSLMRSCSGWPSGVWIDEPRRTVPDGSNFHHQHWTHDLEYALTAGPGDWRRAGLVTRGHEYNHPLHAAAAGVHPGPLGAAGSLVTVEPAGQVVLTALKPRGNPVAAPGDLPDGARGVTLRLYEATGRPADVRVTVPGGFRDAVRSDLLEHRAEPLTTDDGTLTVRLSGAAIATVGGTVEGADVRTAPAGDEPGYARYWRHNRGAAPAGYVPVSVHTDPRPVPADGPRTIEVTIASDHTTTQAKGELTLTGPDGWGISPSAHDYLLAPGAYTGVPVTVTPPPGAEPGTYQVTAELSDAAGHRLREVARFTVPGGAPDDAAPELTAAVTDPEVRVTRGAGGEARIALRNATPGPVSGELHLITPYAAWASVPVPVLPVRLAGHEETVVTVPLTGGAPAGTYWLLPKLMWAGRVGYGAAVRVVVEAAAGDERG